MIGTIIGAGLSVASSVVGGAMSAKAANDAEKEMKSQKAKTDAWFNRQYNQDYADTAAGQNLMRQAKEYGDSTWKKAQGASAVGGGTDSATAMAKEAGNKVVGDTLANIASADVQRKDNIANMKMNADNQYSNQVVNMKMQKAANLAQTASAASDAMFKAGNAYDEITMADKKLNLKKSAGSTTTP